VVNQRSDIGGSMSKIDGSGYREPRCTIESMRWIILTNIEIHKRSVYQFLLSWNSGQVVNTYVFGSVKSTPRKKRVLAGVV
jgi:hypothetical protein